MDVTVSHNPLYRVFQAIHPTKQNRELTTSIGFSTQRAEQADRHAPFAELARSGHSPRSVGGAAKLPGALQLPSLHWHREGAPRAQPGTG